MKTIIFVLILIGGAFAAAALLYFEPFYCCVGAFFSFSLALIFISTTKVETEDFDND